MFIFNFGSQFFKKIKNLNKLLWNITSSSPPHESHKTLKLDPKHYKKLNLISDKVNLKWNHMDLTHIHHPLRLTTHPKKNHPRSHVKVEITYLYIFVQKNFIHSILLLKSEKKFIRQVVRVFFPIFSSKSETCVCLMWEVVCLVSCFLLSPYSWT